MAGEVIEVVSKYLILEFGNAGSRTHEFGVQAKQAVEKAREQIGNVVGVKKTDVTFTSGATESNNLAIFGLREFAEKVNKKHIITTKIEHKSVLEPLMQMEKLGFDVTYLDTDVSGLVSKESLGKALREDTVLVSIMHVNNETGSILDLEGFCKVLVDHDAYFHVDAAQSFGKYRSGLNNKRIDMMSVSAHKVYGPKGVGALISRRRGFKKIPLKPLMFGGDQERGLRPGTLPVALIAGFGEAANLALKQSKKWEMHCLKLKNEAIEAMSELNIVINGSNTAAHVLNFSIPSLNSETAILALKGIVAISNGSACTSSSYTPSHVLSAMKLDEEVIDNAIRMSWCYMIEELPLQQMIEKLKKYL